MIEVENTVEHAVNESSGRRWRITANQVKGGGAGLLANTKR